MTSSKQHSYIFDWELTDDGKIQIPEDVLHDLNTKGIHRLSVNIEPDFEEVFSELKIPKNVVKSIISIQELPAAVIAEFFQSKSAITDKSFLKRIEAYA